MAAEKKAAFITGVARGQGRAHAEKLASKGIFGPVLLMFPFSTELKAGGVYVNGARQNLPHTPFGGLGISGYGKEGGRAGIDEFLRYKTVSIVEPQ